MKKEYFNKSWKLTAWIILLYIAANLIIGRIFRFLSYYIGDIYLDYILLVADLLIVAIVSFEIGKSYVRFVKKKMSKSLISVAILYFTVVYVAKFIMIDVIAEAGRYSLIEDTPSLILFTLLYSVTAYIGLLLGNKK